MTIDEDMLDSALVKAAEHERHDIAGTWDAIKADLKKAGPFSKMILSFRASATEALAELASVKTQDPAVVRLQDEIRRYIKTIEMIRGYRDGAQAVDANAEADVSENDSNFITTLIEGEYDE